MTDPRPPASGEPSLLGFVILHLWRHATVVKGCEGCEFIEKRGKSR
jgi:hypothetical protein